MTNSKKIRVFVVAAIVGFTGTELGNQTWVSGSPGLVSSAEARVGRPLTPVSVAGVSRRTTRRVVRRCASGVTC